MTQGDQPVPPKTQDPARTAPAPDDEVEAARRDPELMRQVSSSIEQMERGERPRPFRDILADLHEKRVG